MSIPDNIYTKLLVNFITEALKFADGDRPKDERLVSVPLEGIFSVLEMFRYDAFYFGNPSEAPPLFKEGLGNEGVNTISKEDGQRQYDVIKECLSGAQDKAFPEDDETVVADTVGAFLEDILEGKNPRVQFEAKSKEFLEELLRLLKESVEPATAE